MVLILVGRRTVEALDVEQNIRPSATLDQTIEQVTRIATNTAGKIGLDRPLRDDEITVVPAYAGFPGLGSPERELSH